MANVTPPPAGPYPPQHQQPPPKKSKVGWIIALVVGVGGCFVVAILAAVLFPVFNQAKISAKRAVVIENYRQVARGVLMYASDHDERLPYYFQGGMDLQYSIGPYVSGLESFYTEGGEIVPNDELVGLSLAEIGWHERTASIYDTIDWPGGGRFVGFLDGSVLFVDTFDYSWLSVYGSDYEEEPEEVFLE